MAYKSSFQPVNVSLRSKAGCNWRYHRVLNIPLLLRLLEDSDSSAVLDEGDPKSSKKRKVPFPDDDLRLAKRVKTSNESESRVTSQNIREGELTNQYPALTFVVGEQEPPSDLPVYSHSIRLQFSTAMMGHGDVDDGMAKNVGWIEEECQLLQALRERTLTSGAKTIRLRPISLALPTGLGLVATSSLRSASKSTEFLFTIPQSRKSAIFDSNNTSYDRDEILHLLYHLADARLLQVYAPLSITFGMLEDSVLRFSLELDINIYLTVPPLDYDTKHGVLSSANLTDAHRCFISFITTSDSVPQDHDTNIPFFYSTLRPAPFVQSLHLYQPRQLKATLLPFQRRSVAWLLAREQKTISPSGDVVPFIPDTLPLFWEAMDCTGRTIYVNRLTGDMSFERPLESQRALGAILAEEPGLGKTLETISLMLLNPAPSTRGPANKQWDPSARIDVKEVNTTLIVTPPALASQWADEILRHSPTLHVFIYEGWNKLKVPITEAEVERYRETRPSAQQKRKARNKASKLQEQVVDWCNFIQGFDVCIVTYQTMRNELYVARPPPTRLRREDVVYSNVQRPRSPLVMCEWYRVVMDEVQMAKGNKTEEMVSLIPRFSSLAVSGTPARSEVADLQHVFNFLRVREVESNKMWKRLLHPQYRDLFTLLCQRYGIRTMKASVKNELTIPQQTRYLVPIQMNAIEKHVYDQTLNASLLDLGLDARGVAASKNWEVNATLLRSIIRKLRGICTHPQVGQLQNAGSKLYKPGALKSMGEVLEGMKEQNWKNLMENCRSQIQTRTKLSQLLLHVASNKNSQQLALEALISAEKEGNCLIEDISMALEAADAKLNEFRSDLGCDKTSRADTPELSSDKGKGKANDAEPLVDDESLTMTPAEEEAATRRRALVSRLKEARVTLHHVKFLQGDVYHILGASYLSHEDKAYAVAEQIRRDLLKIPEENANRAIAQLTNDSADLLTERHLIIRVPYLKQKVGIKSRALITEGNDIVESVLNSQTRLILRWRERLTELLAQKISADDDADGQEYQRSLDSQAEVEVYIQAYAALIADRREALMNERTLLAAHDAREKRLRHTKAAMKAAAALEEMPEHILDDIAPENEVLQKELMDQRKDLVKILNGRAVKSVLVGLNTVATSIRKDDPQKQLVAKTVAAVRQLISDQNNILENLDADLTRFRKAFNERVQYFRQLQEISDSVAEVTWNTETAEEAIEACNVELVAFAASINTGRARDRFLGHLAKNKELGLEDEDEENCCILCRCEFTRGFFTQCAHVFCESCIKAWITRREGKTCPVCRVPIDPEQMQRFTLDETVPNETVKKRSNTETASSAMVPRSRRKVEYNVIDPSIFEAIQQVNIDGSYSEKIKTMVQHLLYIQSTDPGAKSIVFSAWADSLHIVEHALSINGIRSLRVEQKRKGKSAGKIFNDDPDILVLLLHGERENAGLNVTCASRVFMLESVVHHGFEIQAIARIDRMGQTRSTEVYCYFAEDTVEKNILDLAARTGLSLYTKENSAGTVNISDLGPNGGMGDSKKNIDAPTKKAQKGDFIFKVDDMLAILFPHMYEDIEYLIQEDGDVQMSVTSEASGAENVAGSTLSATRWAGGDNAIAGSSKFKR